MANIKSFPNNQDQFIGAEDVMRWLHGRSSGVFGAEGNAAVEVVLDTMDVTVSDGNGWISNNNADGVVWWIDNEAVSGNKLKLSVDMADAVLTRIDRVIVSWQTTNYVDLPTVTILKGVPATNAVPPELTNNNLVRQISLAQIRIPAGSLSLTSEMIIDERLDDTVCGLVTATIGVDTSVMQNQFASLLRAIEEELGDLNAGTAFEFKRLQFENVTVSPSDFESDTTYESEGFVYRGYVQLEGVLSTMTPEVVFSVRDALSGDFAPVAECETGGVYIYASKIPEEEFIIPTIYCLKAVD